MNNSYVKGLVSVVIPTYKRSDMLRRAIESILEQSYNNVECLVVNDNTPGDEFSQILYKLIEKYRDNKRFHFLEQKVHKNGAAARNVGIRAAKGEYIAFLDDDDYWDIEKIEEQIAVLSNLPSDYGAVSCLMRLYRKGKIYSANYPYKDGYIHYEVLTRSISMGTGSLLIRRVALDNTGYFDENLRRFQDPQLFSCLTEKYKVKLIKKYLHNRDVDDAQNRPTIETINRYQEDFFNSVSPQLERLPKKKVEILKTLYNFDKAPIYWRSGEKKQAAMFVLGLLKSPQSVILAFKRIWRKFYSSKCIAARLRKYGQGTNKIEK